MNIKTRLSLRFTFLVFGILVIFSFLVYYFSHSSQRSKYRDNLLVEAKNAAILLINVEEVDSTLLKKIQNTTNSLENEEIIILNSDLNVIYNNNTNYLQTLTLSDYHIHASPWFFAKNEKDGVMYKHYANNKVFYVFVLAFDHYRLDNLRELRNILFWVIVFSIFLSITASYFFSNAAMKPISKVITEVKEINSLKLNKRLNEGHKRDEIEQLAIAFNQMLTELEMAFRNQDEFVSHASHELRTPLAVMIAESDYILNQTRKPDEYAAFLVSMVTDLRKLNLLLNNLLELAHINRDKSITTSSLRIDEVIMNAVGYMKIKYPSRKIITKIDYPENESDLYITGNAGLLEIAFSNLIDNACKFSEDVINVNVTFEGDIISVIVEDSGIGVPETDIKDIFKPFKRASNSKYKGGFGVGLSIVARIAELHSGEIKLLKKENGSKFEFSMARNK